MNKYLDEKQNVPEETSLMNYLIHCPYSIIMSTIIVKATIELDRHNIRSPIVYWKLSFLFLANLKQINYFFIHINNALIFSRLFFRAF